MKIESELVGDCRNFWRWWSARFNAAGLALLTFAQFDPVSTLYVWSMMPDEVREFLPPSFLKITGLILVFLGLLSRIVKQKKLDA